LENEILLARAKGNGVIPTDLALNASLSGPMLRASGVAWDIRKADPYSIYPRFDFQIPVGSDGDSYDRFLVRLAEMRQSLKIVDQALKALPSGPSVDVPSRSGRPGEAYARSSPQVSWALRGQRRRHRPYRYVRAPGSTSPSSDMVVGSTVPDATAAFGSIDIVIGELDR
jgi:NADH:ubiquinone oxidoreductase subunit D